MKVNLRSSRFLFAGLSDLSPRVRLAPPPVHHLSSWVRLVVLFALIVLCFIVFFTVELPIRTGESAKFLGADSGTYYAASELIESGDSSQLTFLGFSGNLLGPVILAYLVKSPFFIMIVNLSIFLVAIQTCAPNKGVSRTALGIMLALNATTIVSIVTLNKEIFALASTLLLCRYLYSEKRSYLLLALLLGVGLLARWQQTFITLLFLYLRRKGSFFRQRPGLSVLLLIAMIAIAYPIALRAASIDLTWATGQAQTGGAIVVLNRIQAAFGFPLVVIPKAMMSLFNRMLNPFYWFTEYPQQDFSDLANQIIQNLACLAMLLIFTAAFVMGRLRLSRPIPYFVALYVTILAASPFIQSRYQYPVYVMLCFDLARQESTRSPLFRSSSAQLLIPRFIVRKLQRCTRDSQSSLATHPSSSV